MTTTESATLTYTITQGTAKITAESNVVAIFNTDK